MRDYTTKGPLGKALLSRIVLCRGEVLVGFFSKLLFVSHFHPAGGCSKRVLPIYYTVIVRDRTDPVKQRSTRRFLFKVTVHLAGGCSKRVLPIYYTVIVRHRTDPFKYLLAGNILL